MEMSTGSARIMKIGREEEWVNDWGVCGER